MISKNALKHYLLTNCVDGYGNLDLNNLDFSDFKGDIKMSGWKVKYNLYQSLQTVGGSLFQNQQKVNGDLLQTNNTVRGNIYQGGNDVNGNKVDRD